MLIPDIVKILTDSGIEPNEANIEVKLLIVLKDKNYER